MTWAAFLAEVRIYLSVHNRRQGIQTLIDRWIIAGVLDLQNSIEYFRNRQVNLFKKSDLITNGYAQKGDAPDGHITSLRILKTDINGNILSCDGGFLSFLPWNQVQKAVCGETDPSFVGAALDKAGHNFYIVPALADDELLEVGWNGLKRSFKSQEPVLFEERCAQAVGEYVLARLSRLVDKDIPLAQSFDASFKNLRRSIYAEYHHRQFVSDFEAADVGIYETLTVSAVVTGYAGTSVGGFSLSSSENIIIPRGDILEWIISDVVDELGNLATSLAGWSFAVYIKDDPTKTDNQSLITLTAGNGITVGSTTARALMTGTQMTTLVDGTRYYFTIKATSPGSVTSTISAGTILEN